MHVAMLLYDNMTPLDFVGPFRVFAVMPGAKISTVAKRSGSIRIDTPGRRRRRRRPSPSGRWR